MFLSTVLLREQTDVFQWLGGACVIAGMLLIGVKKEKETVL
jgi:drug/metabolite transporter (DMT)-like permease